MTDWTEERQEAAQARCDAATKGPWERDLFYVCAEVEGGRPGGEVIIQCLPTATGIRNRKRDDANAEFIAHARTDLPDALAEIKRLNSILRQLETVIKEPHDD